MWGIFVFFKTAVSMKCKSYQWNKYCKGKGCECLNPTIQRECTDTNPEKKCKTCNTTKCKKNTSCKEKCRKTCGLCKTPRRKLNKPIKRYACVDRKNMRCKAKAKRNKCSIGSVMDDCLQSCGFCNSAEKESKT